MSAGLIAFIVTLLVVGVVIYILTQPTPQVQPKNDFSLDFSIAVVGRTATLDDLTIIGAAGPFQAVIWVFGDGTDPIVFRDVRTIDAVSHTYESGGSYTVILSMTDKDGLFAIAQEQVVVG